VVGAATVGVSVRLIAESFTEQDHVAMYVIERGDQRIVRLAKPRVTFTVFVLIFSSFGFWFLLDPTDRANHPIILWASCTVMLVGVVLVGVHWRERVVLSPEGVRIYVALLGLGSVSWADLECMLIKPNTDAAATTRLGLYHRTTEYVYHVPSSIYVFPFNTEAAVAELAQYVTDYRDAARRELMHGPTP